MWLHAPTLPFVHGFSTRRGGVSPAPFDSLNLGGSDDDPANIAENRRRALGALGLSAEHLCTLKQVHGDQVCEAIAPRQEADALVSNRPGSVIGVMVADCYPVLLADEKNGVIGAAHCGWRGTLAGIAARTVERMVALGAEPDRIHAAVGQGIAQSNFEVGSEVITQFREAGFPESAWTNRHLDLVRCILFTLQASGIKTSNTWAMNRCTYEPEFFSHRRDKGRTGRMMGVIALQPR